MNTDQFVSRCPHSSSVSVPAGELMCLPVLLRSTLVCLRIWTRATTRWPSVFKNLKFLPSLCASWKSNVLSVPAPSDPFKGGAIILNTQEPEYVSYTHYALLLLLLPPAAFLIWLLGGLRSCPNKKANQNGSDYWDGVVQAFQWTSKRKP